MEVVAANKHLAVAVHVALDVAGREHLVMMAKATWSIPLPGQRPRPLSPQVLEHADVYEGEPGNSAMLYGSDFVRFKPRCDVLFNAHAHAPAGTTVRRTKAAWQVGPLNKAVQVQGDRVWRKRIGGHSLSQPQPFVSMPLHFGRAFGGTRTTSHLDTQTAKPLSEALLSNPAGMGWAGPGSVHLIHGEPAPNLEAPDDPVQSPTGQHQSVAFSAIGRHWLPRRSHAGSYDEAWQRDVFPFLPEDFDERYNQCAPLDQQMAYPQGGEPVVLINMVAGRPDVRFRLPALDRLSMRVLRSDYGAETLSAVADTLYFETEQGRFSAVWRAATPIRRRLQEFNTLAIGPVDTQWWAMRSLGLNSSPCIGCSAGSTRMPLTSSVGSFE